MRRVLTVLLVGMMLAACSPEPKYKEYSDETTRVEISKPPPAPGVPAQASAPTQPMLAYVYSYDIELPLKALRDLMGRHEEACRAAGPAICQVTSSETSAFGADTASGEMSIRARPDWIAKFRNGLSSEVAAGGGKVTSSGMTAEDLTRTIVDGEARLRAQTTLRDRLQAILASRPGKVSELLEVERELARVQGEIDVAQSELNFAKTRVSTSVLELRYSSRPALASSSTFSPLTGAGRGFVRTIAVSLATMVGFVAAILPWVLVAALFWRFRTKLPGWPWWRRRQKDAEPRSGRSKVS